MAEAVYVQGLRETVYAEDVFESPGEGGGRHGEARPPSTEQVAVIRELPVLALLRLVLAVPVPELSFHLLSGVGHILVDAAPGHGVRHGDGFGLGDLLAVSAVAVADGDFIFAFRLFDTCHLSSSFMENFFGILNTELLYLQDFDPLDQFRTELVKYLDYCNNRRIELRLNGLTPVKHRSQAIFVA